MASKVLLEQRLGSIQVAVLFDVGSRAGKRNFRGVGRQLLGPIENSLAFGGSSTPGEISGQVEQSVYLLPRRIKLLPAVR